MVGPSCLGLTQGSVASMIHLATGAGKNQHLGLLNLLVFEVCPVANIADFETTLRPPCSDSRLASTRTLASTLCSLEVAELFQVEAEG